MHAGPPASVGSASVQVTNKPVISGLLLLW